VLSETLGVRKIIWLPNGVAGDDTSGHVDDFARFAPGGRVLVSDEPNRRDENHAPLRAAQKALAGATNARGKKLEVVKLPMPSPVFYRGERLPASYANFLIANSAVLVPVFNDPRDREALDLIQRCYPDRPAVGIYARDLVVGLGTLHCSSMQEPL
jgi:agmatine deiminase